MNETSPTTAASQDIRNHIKRTSAVEFAALALITSPGAIALVGGAFIGGFLAAADAAFAARTVLGFTLSLIIVRVITRWRAGEVERHARLSALARWEAHGEFDETWTSEWFVNQRFTKDRLEGRLQEAYDDAFGHITKG